MLVSLIWISVHVRSLLIWARLNYWAADEILFIPLPSYSLRHMFWLLLEEIYFVPVLYIDTLKCVWILKRGLLHPLFVLHSQPSKWNISLYFNILNLLTFSPGPICGKCDSSWVTVPFSCPNRQNNSVAHWQASSSAVQAWGLVRLALENKTLTVTW